MGQRFAQGWPHIPRQFLSRDNRRAGQNVRLIPRDNGGDHKLWITSMIAMGVGVRLLRQSRSGQGESQDGSQNKTHGRTPKVKFMPV
jgi:hypothetical protein